MLVSGSPLQLFAGQVTRQRGFSSLLSGSHGSICILLSARRSLCRWRTRSCTEVDAFAVRRYSHCYCSWAGPAVSSGRRVAEPCLSVGQGEHDDLPGSARSGGRCPDSRTAAPVWCSGSRAPCLLLPPASRRRVWRDRALASCSRKSTPTQPSSCA